MRSEIVDCRITLAVFTLFLVFQGAITAQPAVSQPVGTVSGTIMDSSGAVIVLPRPTIIFKGTNDARRVTPDDNGDYEIDLPAGAYDVTTELPGYYPLRRAKFRVLAGSRVTINLVPSPRYLVRGTTVSTNKPVDRSAPRPRYDELRVAISSPLPVCLIQFEKKRIVNGIVKYYWATFSYDNLTIYADELRFNRKQKQLKASGKRVIVEDGKQRVEVKHAVVSLKGREPVLDLTR